MNCPQCKAIIADSVKACPYCGFKVPTTQQTLKKKSTLGKISLLFIGMTIGILVIFFLFLPRIDWGSFAFFNLLILLSIIFSIIAIILGAISYFGNVKVRHGLIGFVLGICFLISSLVLIPATQAYLNEVHPINPIPVESYSITPTINFKKNNAQGTLTVEFTTSEVYWYDLSVIGSYETKPGMKQVEPGDQITGCSGTITVRYTPTDVFVGSWTFT